MSRMRRPHLGFLTVAFVCLWYAFYRADSRQYGGGDGQGGAIKVNGASMVLNTGSRESFIAIAMNTDITGEFDNTAIRSMCANKVWHSDRIFACVWLRGGLGNVRNELLACLRFAIEAGASIYFPGIIQRSLDDVSSISAGESVGLDYLLDLEVFERRLRSSCPEMKLYSRIEDMEQPIKQTPLISPENFTSTVIMKKVMQYPDQWLARFENWYAPYDESPEVHTLIPVEASLSFFPICYDGEDFAKSFGRMIALRKDVRILAASALFEMSRRFGVAIDPAQGVSRKAFFGAHLRTSEDATKAGWMPYEYQRDRYANIAREANLAVIYVASGNMADVVRFAQYVHPTEVVTKFDLLNDSELEYLQSLSWDQQALVDYEILLKSSSFAGMADSSFSWNIATHRRVVSSTTLCPPWPRAVPPNTASKDSLSEIIGGRERVPDFEVGIWP